MRGKLVARCPSRAFLAELARNRVEHSVHEGRRSLSTERMCELDGLVEHHGVRRIRVNQFVRGEPKQIPIDSRHPRNAPVARVSGDLGIQFFTARIDPTNQLLRKLARDGHYWYNLTMHPMFKIARETIPHISSADRAFRTANNHMTNQEVLRAIGKNRALFNTLPAKVALLSNPRTPPTVSMTYLADMTRADVDGLLRKSTIHPELRLKLRQRLQALQ